MRTVWIPEAPNHPGLYANESDHTSYGKIGTGELQPSTRDALKAKQFATREECQLWCDANPVPAFVPREHGFYDSEHLDKRRVEASADAEESRAEEAQE